MTVPIRVFRTKFESRVCPKCRENITPFTDGRSNEMHGYRLTCPECNQWIGWGGKQFAEHARVNENESMS